MVAVFKLGRREVAEGGVSALAVVEGLDVLEDGGLGLPSGAPGLTMEQLGLEGGEEALGDGVVPAGAGAANAWASVVLEETIGVGVGEVLRAPDALLFVKPESESDQRGAERRPRGPGSASGTG